MFCVVLSVDFAFDIKSFSKVFGYDGVSPRLLANKAMARSSVLVIGVHLFHVKHPQNWFVHLKPFGSFEPSQTQL
jgi:hypothetical protein